MSTKAATEPPVIWRTKLRSTLHVQHDRQVQHCIDHGLIGIGWQVPELESGASLEEILEAISSNPEPGWGRRAAGIVRRIGHDAQVGEFVWTRDTAGHFLLCRISGPYRYDNSPEAREVDVHQTRPVDWAPRPLGDLEVPGAVIRNFAGTGESFSRIWDAGARTMTAWLWEKLHDRPLPPLAFTPRDVLTSLLEPYDVEDLIYVWMQVAGGYLALPKARRTDMPAYEWTMLHRESGRSAIVQVKTGDVEVDLEQLANAAPDDQTDIFAYATRENGYAGTPSRPVRKISTEELLDFVAANQSLLPPRVRTWFELAQAET